MDVSNSSSVIFATDIAELSAQEIWYHLEDVSENFGSLMLLQSVRREGDRL